MIDAFFWFEAGYCTMYDRFARRGGAWQRVRFSAAVGLLLEKDRLKLDDEIQSYLPAYPRKQWPVTLRQ